jgi:hypothetical protein
MFVWTRDWHVFGALRKRAFVCTTMYTADNSRRHSIRLYDRIPRVRFDAYNHDLDAKHLFQHYYGFYCMVGAHTARAAYAMTGLRRRETPGA